VLPIGKGRIVREGKDVALLGFGTRLGDCLKAAEALAAKGISVTVADARFAKPLDEALVTQLLKTHAAVITIEEGSSGGFGAAVLAFASNAGLLDTGSVKLRALTLPDMYQAHDTHAKQLAEAGLDAEHIAQHVLELFHSAQESHAA
jgi:1-deoxy-D-xylulose-5-phosphate synthase